MKAEIISVGTEILLGQIVNTNAQYLTGKLNELGIDVFYITCVGDNSKRLKEILKLASKRSDLIILSGGLGPTSDDITKEVVCDFLDLSLRLNQGIADNIKCYFQNMGRDMKHNNLKQAYFPEDAIILKNEKGTAPGCIIENKARIYVLLPGPPGELKAMFDNSVYPYLLNKSDMKIYSKEIKLFGIGESSAEELIKDILLQQSNPTVAPLAHEGEVSIRITAKAENKKRCLELIKPVEEQLKEQLKGYIYGSDGDTLESILVSKALAMGVNLTVAESCTGGLVANQITNVPGASQIFTEGFVVYSNGAKERTLSVPSKLIEQYSAVSPQVAEAMAKGALVRTGADIAVSTTGYAGPKGEQVGLIYIGLTDGTKTVVQKIKLTGERRRIKLLAAKHALNQVRLFIENSIKLV